RLNRYLWKFHFGTAASPSSPSTHLYRGWALTPMTCSFAVNGKSTLKRVSQKVLISVSVPGSCDPKSLHGTPSTTRLSSRFALHSASSPEYCGVSPHWLATFTTSSALPLKFASGRL